MKKNMHWAFKTFVLSIFLSIFFSVISQSIFPVLPAFISLFIIVFFIAVSVVFDIISVAVTCAEVSKIEKFKGQKGSETALRLCQNTEKIASFCGDVVGDICGILSGAGGVSLVVNLSFSDPNLQFVTTCCVSALIAGLTIFGKAVMKSYAVKNSEKVVMLAGKIMETSALSLIKLCFLKLFGRKIKRKKTVFSEKNKKNHKNS